MNLSPLSLFDPMPVMVRRDSGLSDAEKILYLTYLSYARKKGECFPGIDTLAEELNKHPRTIKKIKKGLIRSGLIRSDERFRKRCLVRIVPLEDVYRFDAESGSWFRRSREEIEQMSPDILGVDDQDRPIIHKGTPPAAPKKRVSKKVVEVDPITGDQPKKEAKKSEFTEKRAKYRGLLVELIKRWRVKHGVVFGGENELAAVTNGDLNHALHIFDRAGKDMERAWKLMEYAIDNWNEIKRSFGFVAKLPAPNLLVVDKLKETLEYMMSPGKKRVSESIGTGVHRADNADKMMDEFDRKLAELRAQHAEAGKTK